MQILKTSLTLAAELGNALLQQNSKLKQEILDLTLKNLDLETLQSLASEEGWNLCATSRKQHLKATNTQAK